MEAKLFTLTSNGMNLDLKKYRYILVLGEPLIPSNVYEHGRQKISHMPVFNYKESF